MNPGYLNYLILSCCRSGFGNWSLINQRGFSVNKVISKNQLGIELFNQEGLHLINLQILSYDVPYSLTLKSRGFIKQQINAKPHSEMMTRKCPKMHETRKKQLVKKSAYKQTTTLQKDAKTSKQNEKIIRQTKSEQNTQQMHTHNQISHTTFFVHFLAMFVQFMCDMFAFWLRFLRFPKHTQKMQKQQRK